MRKLLCLMLAVVMIASVAVVAVSAEGTGKATVTLKNVFGDEVTQTYAVGETFTAYTYLNCSNFTDGKGNPGGIGSLNATQHYDSAILEVADEYEKDETAYDWGMVTDPASMFPVLGDSTVGNAGTHIGDIYYNNSLAIYKGFPFKSDDSALIIVNYTVKAAGEATIENSFTTLAVADESLTRLVDKGTIVNPNFSMPIALSMPAAPAGVTISGNITSYNTTATASADVTVVLTGTDNNYTDTKVGTADYTFENVPAGAYKITVSKANHVARDYEVTVADADVTQDVKICPLGDVSQDGKITSRDSSQAFQISQGKGNLTAYQKKCGDVVKNDGKVTSADASRIFQHSQGKTNMWKA